MSGITGVAPTSTTRAEGTGIRGKWVGAAYDVTTQVDRLKAEGFQGQTHARSLLPFSLQPSA